MSRVRSNSPLIFSASDMRHIAHIRKFVKWFSVEQEVDPLFGHALLKPDRGEAYRKPNECYLDAPLYSTGLSAIYEGDEKPDPSRTALWSGYADTFQKTPGFIDFLTAVGVQTELEIRQVSIDDNPGVEYLTDVMGGRSSYCVEEDYTIAGLTDLLERRDPAVAKLIWRTVSCASPSVLHARYTPNASAEERRAPSQLVYLLTTIAWIPASGGGYRKASEMTVQDLLPGFEWDDRNGWLDTIGFGEEEKRASDEHKTRESHAAELGLSLEDVELLGILREHPDAFENVRKLCEGLRRPDSFPVRTSADPDRRSQKVEEQWEDSTSKTYQRRELSVRSSSPTEEIKAVLRHEYSDQHGDMHCQICQGVMPFRGRDDQYYFVAREASQFRKVNWQQYLALCPLCDAKFVEFVRRDDDAGEEFCSNLLEQESDEQAEAESSPLVRIRLGSEQSEIRFTRRHLADLVTILTRERDSGPSS